MNEDQAIARTLDEQDYTYYGFRACVGGYFEMSTSNARALIPPHLEPLEAVHSRSILAITAFQFTDSLVGAYDEVVLAVVVPPRVEAGRPLPKAAFFPFMVGTSTEAARRHAIERWHLPHYMRDLNIAFAQNGEEMAVQVSDDGAPVLDLSVTQYRFTRTQNIYTAFTVERDERFKVNIYMEAEHSEHEEERGALTLHEHPMTGGLALDEVNSWPFREEWYGAGMQTFEPLESI
jgi:hypothetical protein